MKSKYSLGIFDNSLNYSWKENIVTDQKLKEFQDHFHWKKVPCLNRITMALSSLCILDPVKQKKTKKELLQ